MSGLFRLLFFLPSPLPNDPERKLLTLDLTRRRLLPRWLPLASSESLDKTVTEAVLAAGFEAATKVLVADDSSNGQDCFGVSVPEDVLEEF